VPATDLRATTRLSAGYRMTIIKTYSKLIIARNSKNSSPIMNV
jgi:hypothetical protein